MGTSHTIAREFILTTSPEFFEASSKKETEDWITENIDWLRNRFGNERVKFACVHFDEQTPHISAYIVGIKEDKNRKGEPNKRGNGWTLSDSSIGLGGGKNELEILTKMFKPTKWVSLSLFLSYYVSSSPEPPWRPCIL